MHNEFSAVIEKTEQWYIAYSPEMPGAFGQGKTLDECRESLAQAIVLLLEDRREDGMRDVPSHAIVEVVTVERPLAA